jgi:hypothetical protein
MDLREVLNSACHVLVWYSGKDESLAGEYPIRGIGIEQLQATFRPPQGDPLLYDSYSVGDEEAKFLGKALGIDLDLDHYDFFIECDAADPAVE